MDKKDLIKHVEAGLSTYKIAELENLSNSTIRYWMRKYD